jgi:exopolysaccharide biosynthesis protein
MYQIKNKIYADAGCVLKYNNKVAFSFEDVDMKDVLETKINLENMRKSGNFVVYDGLKDRITRLDYGRLKSKFINKQFTNDDQIAIILNKDDSKADGIKYQKMME